MRLTVTTAGLMPQTSHILVAIFCSSFGRRSLVISSRVGAPCRRGGGKKVAPTREEAGACTLKLAPRLPSLLELPAPGFSSAAGLRYPPPGTSRPHHRCSLPARVWAPAPLPLPESLPPVLHPQSGRLCRPHLPPGEAADSF